MKMHKKLLSQNSEYFSWGNEPEDAPLLEITYVNYRLDVFGNKMADRAEYEGGSTNIKTLINWVKDKNGAEKAEKVEFKDGSTAKNWEKPAPNFYRDGNMQIDLVEFPESLHLSFQMMNFEETEGMAD